MGLESIRNTKRGNASGRASAVQNRRYCWPMAHLTYITAGESHGPALVAIVSGMPAGVEVDLAFINAELARRQGGYGRGARQRIETDVVEVLSGVRLGKSIGSPIALKIANKDSRLEDVQKTPPVPVPRPGHADLAGSVKYLTTDCRETLERASAARPRRVAAGALFRCLLRAVGIEVFGFVRSILDARWEGTVTEDNWRSLVDPRDASETYSRTAHRVRRPFASARLSARPRSTRTPSAARSRPMCSAARPGSVRRCVGRAAGCAVGRGRHGHPGVQGGRDRAGRGSVSAVPDRAYTIPSRSIPRGWADRRSGSCELQQCRRHRRGHDQRRARSSFGAR